MLVTGSLFLLLAAQSSAAPQRPDFTSSDLADAAEHLTSRRAHMSDEIRLLAGMRLAGPAITMRLVRDDSASLRAEGLAAIQFIEAAPRGAVVIVAMDGEKAFAVFGSTFATLAQSRGLAGFIIEGAVRGLPEIRRLGFPTFARGTVAGSAGGHYRIDATNVPVTIGGVEVSPGDLVVGDEDGVAVAPGRRRDEVSALAVRLRKEKEELLPLIAGLRSYTEAVAAQRRRAGSRP